MRNADALHDGSVFTKATVCGFDNLSSTESATFIRYFFLVIGRTTPLELTNGNNMTSEFVTRTLFTRTTAGTRGTTNGDTTAKLTSTKLITSRQCCSGTVGSFNTRDSSSQLGLLVTNSCPHPCSRPLVYPPPLKPTSVTTNETQKHRDMDYPQFLHLDDSRSSLNQLLMIGGPQPTTTLGRTLHHEDVPDEPRMEYILCVYHQCRAYQICLSGSQLAPNDAHSPRLQNDE